MSVGSPTAGTWSSSQWRPDNEFETDRPSPSTWRTTRANGPIRDVRTTCGIPMTEADQIERSVVDHDSAGCSTTAHGLPECSADEWATRGRMEIPPRDMMCTG